MRNKKKKLSNSTQKYTQAVIIYKLEKEPEQELTCSGFFVPCSTRKGLSMSMLDGDVYERTNSILEYYLPIRLKEAGLDCKVESKRDGPRNLKVSLSIPGSEEVRVFDTEPKIREMHIDQNAMKAFSNLLTFFSAQVRLMEMELTECCGIHRKKNGLIHIPSKYALLDDCYISLLPKEDLSMLPELPYKRLAEGSDIYAVIGVNIYDERDNHRRYNYLTHQVLKDWNIPEDEAWKAAEKNTIRITKPEVFPFFQKSLDQISDGDVYNLEAREVPYVASGSIALPGFLKKVAENVHHNLWIFPLNNADAQFYLEGSKYPCSMDTVDRLTKEFKDLLAVGNVHRILPGNEILHYDRKIDALETGENYVQRAYGFSRTAIEPSYDDYDSVFSKNFPHL